MNTLDKDIQLFELIKANIEGGKWVLIHNQKMISTFDTFEKAAEEAVHLFGAGPYLIRQVGAQPVVLPASVVFRVSPHG